MLAHIVWAAGWYVGLPLADAQEMFLNPWKWAYDVVVAVACGIAVVVALALVRHWGQRVPRRLLNVLAWSGTGLLVLRGAGGVVQVGYWAVTDQWVPRLMDLYEVWFCLGAVLFGASLARFRRTDPASAAAGRP